MSRPGCSCIGVFADKLSGRASRKGAGDANGAEGKTRQLTVVAVIWPRPSPMHRLRSSQSSGEYGAKFSGQPHIRSSGHM